MQDIVYKLVPGLYKSKYKGKCMICSQSSITTGEQKRREEFYLERGETDPSELWTNELNKTIVYDTQACMQQFKWGSLA